MLLFLDDLHWCDDRSALKLIEGILSDKDGSSLFFVGSYRSNEIQDGHALYHFMDSLSVNFTKINLFGINYNDLNTMISDAMGIFPRLCAPLSDVIFSKVSEIATGAWKPISQISL